MYIHINAGAIRWLSDAILQRYKLPSLSTFSRRVRSCANRLVKLA